MRKNMSVYTCEQCSFYSDKHSKHMKHLASQKHRENTERILGKPPSTRAGQSIAAHRLLKRAPETSQTPAVIANNSPTVFTLLEVTNNRVVGSRQIDMNNSVIRFVN